MLARIRLIVPDRPGSLGAVASAIGAAGADIAMVDVLGVELGRATDDIRVQVGSMSQLDRAVQRLSGVVGVEVVAVTAAAASVSGHGELELIRTIMANPGASMDELLSTLADQAAGSLEVDWAAACAVVDPVTTVVLASSSQGPAVDTRIEHPVRLAPLPVQGPIHRLLVPMQTGHSALLLGRRGLAFHHGEVNRLGELGKILGGLVHVEAFTPA